MPKPNPPPTPGSSSDIRAKDNPQTAPAFRLPPAAYHDRRDRASTESASSSTTGSDSSYQPVSPNAMTTGARKRAVTQSGPIVTKEDFSLPPPPTRSRKIIQMKPRESAPQHQQQQPAHDAAQASAVPPQAETKSTTAGPSGGKRKQASSGTTAAGRKIARKTAHSLIERRRRSKMNEEFGVLKDMIPACQGQEMHKLAILQASIDYLRYLEQCVSDLQAQNSGATSVVRPPTTAAAKSDSADDDHDVDDEEDDDDNDGDEEMTDDHHPRPQSSHHPSASIKSSQSVISLPPLSQITSSTPHTTSPSVFSTNGERHYSISSAASQHSYSPLYPSNHTSPAFGPQLHHASPALLQFSQSYGLGSPALNPQDPSPAHLRHIAKSAADRVEKYPRPASYSTSSSSANFTGGTVGAHSHQPPASTSGRIAHELDQEATAALLMLNHDRRNWRAAPDLDAVKSSAGISVQDLLSG